ncbi:glycosyltransferase family 4 protein [Acinetobacter radioresistens]|uniref:Glycosyltransferase n=1 Tax=Acinetobacter radioresistens TaxID=40216 RepID=A0A8H2JXT1_ACIRA|nr:glycosyltransferase [Acinetobacter radioresistens]TNX86275.1 glycosyltransferase [Acinetobacter radioresistens]
MSKKIVHIIIGLNIGGAELMLKRLVLHSQEKGKFHHEVISLSDLGAIGYELKQAGIPVYTLNMKSIFSLFNVFYSLRKLLKKIHPNVVQTWMYHADFIGGLVAKSLGIKKIIWGIRTTDVTQGGSKLTVILRNICAKLSYSIPTNIICAAHVSKDLHIKVGYDASKIQVIANGFELDKLVVGRENRDRIRQEFDISKEAIVIGSIGRFNIVKNQKFFVDVAVKLVELYPNLIFMLVGRDNTSNNNELMNWLKESNLIDNFRLLGQRNDVYCCLKAMDIFCLHSKTEGFPNVLGEAMGIGVIAVSTNVGDVPYLIDHKFIGSSLEELIFIISSIIDNKINIAEEIIRNKKKIENFYSMDKVISSYELVYLEE